MSNEFKDKSRVTSQRPMLGHATRSFAPAPRDQSSAPPPTRADLPVVGLENGKWKVQPQTANLEQLRELTKLGEDYLNLVERANELFLRTGDMPRLDYLAFVQERGLEGLNNAISEHRLAWTTEAQALIELNDSALKKVKELRRTLADKPSVVSTQSDRRVVPETLERYDHLLAVPIEKHQIFLNQLLYAKESLESSYSISQGDVPSARKRVG